MVFLKNAVVLVIVAGLFCCLISFSTGDSSFISVGGLVAVLVGIFAAYIAYKLLWSVMGIYLNFTIIALVCLAVIYSLYNLSSDDAQPSISSPDEVFAELQEPTTENVVIQAQEVEPIAENKEQNEELDKIAKQAIAAAGDGNNSAEVYGEVSRDDMVQGPMPAVNYQPQLVASQEKNSKGTFEEIKSWFSGMFSDEQPINEEQRKVYNNINPFDYPSVSGHPRVMRGSVLLLNGYNLRLYGIEAPYPNQTCADNHGRSYACGRNSITWLQNWINNREVTCYVLGKLVNNWATAICLADDGKYDLAAAVTSAGWAVAYTKNTDIYVPYEREAAKNRRGLWNGTFYKPWDWYKMQTRKVKITITDSKSKSFDFWGLF